MQEKTMTTEKYIRKDDPELDESVDYINYLVDAYKQTGEDVYREALIASFDDYFRKYVAIMHGRGTGVNVNNSDTKSFLRLFMKKSDRATQALYHKTVGSYIHMLRRSLVSFSKDDLYNELIVYFLELLEKYDTVTYKRGDKTHRISFAHYAQVNIRYKLCRWIVKTSQDVITGRNWVEFDEDMVDNSGFQSWSYPEQPVGIDLKNWVWGTTSTKPFSDLTEMERYLLWLRFEGDPNDRKLSTREMALLTGYHERTIIYKLNKIKVKLKVEQEAL